MTDATNSTSYPQLLPRIYELIAQTDLTQKTAYFRDFEQRFSEGHTVLGYYQKLEQRLTELDADAWNNLRDRAAPLARKCSPGRGWQEMFDVVYSEATAYVYLKRTGCTNIRFIDRAEHRTADLSAVRHGRPIICEVKTINKSEEQAILNERIHNGEFVASRGAVTLSAEFLDNKLTNTLARAKDQLLKTPGSTDADHMIFTVLYFDDWIGDFQARYIAQIDDHLQANPVAGVELIFHPGSELFGRTFTMENATVFMG